MKKGAVLLLLLLPIIFVACRGVSATQVERELYAKLDKGDVAGALALTTEDAVFDIPGCPEGGCKGKDAIKSAFEGAVAQHTRHTIKSSKDSKNTATSQVEDELDLAKAAGVQRVVLKVNLEVKGGKIARFQAQFDTSDPQTATVVNYRRVTGLHQRFVEAVARGDVEGALALFADDAVIEGRGVCARTPCRGKAEIRKEIERVVNERGGATLTNVQVSGDTTTARIEVRNDPAREAGVERLVGTQSLEARGDKIAAIRFKIDASDPQTATLVNFGRLSRILRQHIDAINRGDVAAAVAAFTDDAEVRRGNRCPPAVPCVGKKDIQAELEQTTSNTFQTRFQIIDLQVTGNTVTVRLEQRNLPINQDAGLERVIAKHTVTFQGDKISRYFAEFDLSDPQSAQFDNLSRVTTRSTSRRNLALNRGDVPGVMAVFADDAVFAGLGLCAPAPCAGKVAIQKEMQRQVADHTTVANVPRSVSVSGDQFNSKLEIKSDSTKAAGVERVLASVTAEVKGEKIVSLRYVLEQTDPQTATYLKATTLRQHYEAINKGDLAAAMAIFANDASAVRGSICTATNPCAGKAVIERQVGREVRDRFRFDISSIQLSANVITARVEVRGILAENAGVERFIENHTVTFKEDKISRFTAERDLSDSQTATFANYGRVTSPRGRQNEALGRGDVAAVMAEFADDAVLEGLGLCASAPCVGKAAIQKEIERQAADKSNIRPVPGTVRVTGDSFTSKLQISSESTNAAGVERVIVAVSGEVKGAKITALRYSFDTTDPQTATYLKSQAK